MSDTYVECLIKAKQSGLAKAGRVLLIVLTVFSAIGMILFFNWVFLLLAVVFGVAAYFLNMMTDLEYEYQYLDRELTVDKIMAKSRRKRVTTFSVDRIEIMAPVNSYHLDNYKNRQTKTKDYSIGEVQQPDLRYAMYYEGGLKILLSPSVELMKAMKNVAPRKIFTD